MVKGNQPSLQRAVYDAIQQDGPRDPDHTELDYGHGRIIRRSIWVTDADGIDFPHVTRVARIRRDGYDIDRHPDQQGNRARRHQPGRGPRQRRQTSPGSPAASGASNRCTGCATPPTRKTPNTGYAGNGPQVMATLRNLAVSLLYLAGVTEITRTLQAIGRDRTRMLDYLPL